MELPIPVPVRPEDMERTADASYLYSMLMSHRRLMPEEFAKEVEAIADRLIEEIEGDPSTFDFLWAIVEKHRKDQS